MPTVLAPAETLMTKCQITLTVPGADADNAGQHALVVLDEFLAQVEQEYPSYDGLALEVEYPAARKGEAGLFTVQAWLRCGIPLNLRAYGMPSALQSWRQILFVAFRRACDLNHSRVIHARSWVGVVRPFNPEEEKAAEESVEAAPKKMLAIKVTIGGVLKEIQVAEGGNLLDECLDHGAELDFQCKAGVCDSCKVFVRKGMENLSEITDNERTMLEDLVDQGWRLSCQCIIKGPVEIDQPR